MSHEESVCAFCEGVGYSGQHDSAETNYPVVWQGGGRGQVWCTSSQNLQSHLDLIWLSLLAALD